MAERTDEPPVPVHLTPFLEGRGRPAATGPLDGDGRRSVYLAVRRNFLNPRTPVLGELLPVLGLMAFYDRTWNDKWTSSAGYSRVDIDTTSGQLPSDFKRGEYALGNLLYYPVKNVLVGGEFQWARRDNHSDGFRVDDKRVQFSFKYSFSYKVGGQS